MLNATQQCKNDIRRQLWSLVVSLVKPCELQIRLNPTIFLGSETLNYVDKFKYLGHLITNQLSDDEDMEREARRLCTRGDLPIPKFYYCSADMMCHLFQTYCYQTYTCSLWAKNKQRTLNRLRVCYNNVRRKLLGIPLWSSASSIFVTRGLRGFQENL